MRVLLAFDKFKDALSAPQACEAAAAALRAKHPDWQLDLCPLTDGGEGFTEILTRAAGGTLERVEVSGPRGGAFAAALGRVEVAGLPPAARQRLGLPDAGSLAVVDMASASGLALLAPAERNPWYASSVGTGQLLAAATAGKPAAILLGVGGSATNDLGLGALTALGLQFFDAFGQPVQPPVPARWDQIVRAVGRANLPPLFIACDVTHPLLGQRGATATFGPQKGLPPTDVLRLDTLAARLAAVLCDHCEKPRSLATTPGAGAAGGLPFGLMVAAGARLVPGFDLVSDWLGLSRRIAAADLVLTGEGRFDATSLGGKGPGRLAAQVRRAGKPAYVFAGSLDLPALSGIDAPADHVHHAITPAEMPLIEALPRTAELLAAAVARIL
jgi:glycerate kinase